MTSAIYPRFPWKWPLLTNPEKWLRVDRGGCVRPDAAGRWPRVAILARSRVRMRSFKLGELPAAERLPALRAQAIAWEPFLEPELNLAVRGDRGLALAWDKSALGLSLAEAQLPAADLQIWPEPLMRAPLDNGVRLLQGIDGFDAECWQDGWLLGSRWWPAMPDGAAWHDFVRSLGEIGLPERSASEIPPPQQLALQARPWIALRPLADIEGRVGAMEGLIVRGGLACCAVVSAAVAHQLWDAHGQVEAGKLELQALRTSAASTLAARDEALRLAAETSQLASVMGGALPLEVMQHLARVLPKDVIVREMEISGAQLRLGVDAPPALARSALIKAMQEGGWLKDVREIKANAVNSNTMLEMRIDGLQAPAPEVSAPKPPATER